MEPQRARAFIIAETAVLPVPHVPEIRLHQADEAHDLWRRTEDELAAIGLEPPFWAFAWAGGQALARYVLDHREEVRGARVLDFAAGSALVAIAAMKAGAAHVLAVDIDPFAAQAMQLNMALNGTRFDIACTDLVGGQVEVDVILAGDVFFDRDMAAAILPWFERLAAEGRTILVGDPGRAYLPKDRLDHLATYEVPVTRALEDAEVKRTSVWRWRNR